MNTASSADQSYLTRGQAKLTLVYGLSVAAQLPYKNVMTPELGSFIFVDLNRTDQSADSPIDQ